jgi:hypothetical protein
MKIYIECPALAQSGGPELLHQLCRELLDLGFDASMYYVFIREAKEVCPIPEPYLKYHTPYITDYSLYDSNVSVLIVPETGIEFLDECKKGKKIIWWLSVDNYTKKYVDIIQANELSKNIDLLNITNMNVSHFVQSFYAWDFIKNTFHINEDRISYLSDYLNDSFHINANSMRGNFVLYNPLKGMEFTKALIHMSPNINWLPLANLTAEEVANFMMLSKIYIDFGNHPGKDRIPREAAISGCCIITNKKGSAKNAYDVEIPDKYKFDNETEHLEDITLLIQDILTNFDKHSNDFESYRQKISSEKEVFTTCTKEIFTKIDEELDS